MRLSIERNSNPRKNNCGGSRVANKEAINKTRDQHKEPPARVLQLPDTDQSTRPPE